MGRYFLWDSVVCLVHYEGFGFMMHGAQTSLDSFFFFVRAIATNIFFCLIVLRNRLLVGLP